MLRNRTKRATCSCNGKAGGRGLHHLQPFLRSDAARCRITVIKTLLSQPPGLCPQVVVSINSLSSFFFRTVRTFRLEVSASTQLNDHHWTVATTIKRPSAPNFRLSPRPSHPKSPCIKRLIVGSRSDPNPETPNLLCPKPPDLLKLKAPTLNHNPQCLAAYRHNNRLLREPEPYKAEHEEHSASLQI